MTHPMDIAVTTPWWRNRLFQIAAAVGLLLIVLFIGSRLLGNADGRVLRVPAEQLSIGTASKTVFHDVLPLSGEVQPKELVFLDAVEGGQIQELIAKPGDLVAAGQPLILFRNAQLNLDVLNNAGRLIESITQLQSFETQLENNRATNSKALADVNSEIAQLSNRLSRIDPLVKRGFYPSGDAAVLHDQLTGYRKVQAIQRETNERQEAQRIAQLPQIRAEQVSLRQSLEATHAQLDNLIVRSPVDGVITQLDLKLGQNRERGDRLGQIMTNAGFKIAVKVDQYYLSRVKEGQRGQVAIGGKNYPVHVQRVIPDVSNGAFTAELEFDGPAPGELTAGAAVQVSLSLGSDQRALIIPSGAFLDTRQGDTLFVLGANGDIAVRRAVQLGRHTDSQVEILRGLKPGDRVITSDYSTYARIDTIKLQR